jgi:hypothetical protein
MQWTDVVRPPSNRMIRQFAGLFLVVFLAMAGWRWWQGRQDVWTISLAGLAIAVGLIGQVAPAAIRPLYTAWMVVAFPIGWTVSRIVLGAVFFGVVTPMAVAFRAAGRDPLRLRRRAETSYWLPKRQPASDAEYFRQS